MAKPTLSRRVRAIALVLCACLAVALVGSALFLSLHSHHHCTGPSCQTCCHLYQAGKLLEKLCHGLACAAPAALATVAAVLALLLWARAVLPALTPVQNRVRLND